VTGLALAGKPGGPWDAASHIRFSKGAGVPAGRAGRIGLPHAETIRCCPITATRRAAWRCT